MWINNEINIVIVQSLVIHILYLSLICKLTIERNDSKFENIETFNNMLHKTVAPQHGDAENIRWKWFNYYIILESAWLWRGSQSRYCHLLRKCLQTPDKLNDTFMFKINERTCLITTRFIFPRLYNEIPS